MHIVFGHLGSASTYFAGLILLVWAPICSMCVGEERYVVCVMDRWFKLNSKLLACNVSSMRYKRYIQLSCFFHVYFCSRYRAETCCSDTPVPLYISTGNMKSIATSVSVGDTEHSMVHMIQGCLAELTIAPNQLSPDLPEFEEAIKICFPDRSEADILEKAYLFFYPNDVNFEGDILPVSK